ncbi:MAG: hypothetical protein AAGD38_08830 [Acidobacteriota bacterium]
MKVRTLLFCLALALVAFHAPADEVHRHSELRLIDSETGTDTQIDLEALDLEVGQTYQQFTDSGKEIVITRTDEGYDVEIDGKNLFISDGGADGTNLEVIATADDEGTEVKTKVIRIDTSGTQIHGEHGAQVWIDSDGGVTDLDGSGFAFHVGDQSAARDALIESGALDELSEEQRQRILDALGGVETENKVIMIKKVIEDTDSDN